MPRITALEALDLRFPTSLSLDGSDAMNPDPDYSAAYAIIRTDAGDGLEGHGFTFTIGRGNQLCVSAIEAYAPYVVGRDLDEVLSDMGAFWRSLAGESQLRWLGPEKGVVHLALAAVVNAVWDLYAKKEGKPLWKLLADMTPEQIVALVDFRHIGDELSPEAALDMLRRLEPTKQQRIESITANGLPAYTTSAGWLGYDDDKMRRLAREAIDAGFTHMKIKVGRDLDDDLRRTALLREEIGPDRYLMVDANQVWNVDEAIKWIQALAPYNPWWIEEPTSPDDVLGHAEIARQVAPIRVATGEHIQNRVMFKQFLQAKGMGVCQIDACRVGGVNENIAIMLLAAQHNIPVCPHAGGVGLCEYVQHLSIFNYIAVAGNLDDVVVEFVDHLHEHFVDPCIVDNGHYVVPSLPGYSAEILADSREKHRYPDGQIWVSRS
ncbi:L-fuconate dehydratase [soil metagenome]|uniref:L-fuconate dehydratase n=2 Tax=Mycobacteriaceae TaxID=1762 RepID=UPI0009794008|nr:L-fuconate dehydratase [Mycobacterium sp. MS1601]AQA07203.1 fuconate dehydratase [Mycobacterium sp. MS1601]